MNTQDEDILITKFLAGEASETEVANLSAWRKSNPAHESRFLQSQAIWNRARQRDDAIDADAAWMHMQDKLTATQQKKTFGWTKIAAALLFLSAAAWFSFRQFYNPSLSTLTAANEQKEVILPDGSHVWLNGSSSLHYPQRFSSDQRRVVLSGEAFFDIVKNPEQPFVIVAEQAITEVLGTSFNLKVLKGEKTATLNVLSGTVRFSSTGNKSNVIVTAGEKAQIDEKGNATETGQLKENDFAWKSGKLVFNDNELKDVFKTLQAYFKITVTVDNPSILSCHFTGTFDSPKVDEVFEVISKALQLHYTRKGKTITIKGKGCAL